MTDPVTTLASAAVVVIIFAVGTLIFYAGGIWPLLFFISATAVQSDHGRHTPE